MRRTASLFLLALAACSGPRDTPLPKDLTTMETIRPAMEKLSQEDRELAMGYIFRHTVGSALGAAFGVKPEPIPDGMTLGKAIDEQRTLVDKNKAAEAAKKLEKEKAAAARKEAATQMAQVMTVRLAGIRLHKASYRDFDVENQILISIDLENRGSKPISGMKGTATFKDKFGDILSELPIKFEQEIPAGKTATLKLSKRFNQFDLEDRALASLDAATVDFSVAPEVILFGDGTKFEALKAK